jgi:hypothetical protein
MPPVSARHDLKPAQQRALALLRDGRERVLTRGAYQALCGVSRSQAAYDLAELVEAGVLERVGGGRSTRYVLVRQPNSTRRHWTSDRIRAELAHFCEGRTEWPSAREFKAAGRADLYVAASRYGGIAFWAGEVGLARTPRRWEPRPFARLRLSLSWAMIGAVGGALGVAGVFAIVQGFPRHTPTSVAHHARSVAAPKTSGGKNSQTQAQKTAKSVKHVAPAAPKVVKRTRTHRDQSTPSTSSGSGTAVLAARTVSSASSSPSTTRAPTTGSTSSPTPTRTTSSSSSSTSSGPTPLMAPRQSSSTPPPLPPPTP